MYCALPVSTVWKPMLINLPSAGFGNAIGQVRTNEIAFASPWQLREFTLQDTGGGINAEQLLNDTVKMTPDNGLNLGPDLDGWLRANVPDILNMKDIVPLSFFPGPPPFPPGPFAPPDPPVG